MTLYLRSEVSASGGTEVGLRRQSGWTMPQVRQFAGGIYDFFYHLWPHLLNPPFQDDSLGKKNQNFFPREPGGERGGEGGSVILTMPFLNYQDSVG